MHLHGVGRLGHLVRENQGGGGDCGASASGTTSYYRRARERRLNKHFSTIQYFSLTLVFSCRTGNTIHAIRGICVTCRTTRLASSHNNGTDLYAPSCLTPLPPRQVKGRMWTNCLFISFEFQAQSPSFASQYRYGWSYMLRGPWGPSRNSKTGKPRPATGH